MTLVLDPTTGERAFEAPDTPAPEAKESVARARDAQREWARRGAQGRGAVLVAAADRIAADKDLAALIVSDVGKPVVEARAEVGRTAAILRYIASLAHGPAGELYEDATGGQIRVIHVPRGVAVLITPWNFPAAIPTWKLAPALQAGNAVCLKPATPGTRIAERLAEHLHAAGVPREVLQVVPGGAETAEALLDAAPDAVSFTGSTKTGRKIAERMAGRFVPLQLEMGGKNGVYVSADADPAQAATIALAGAMGYAGQKCTATSLLFVHERAAEAVRTELDRQADALGVGDPREESVSVGPIIAAEHRDAIANRLTEASERGVTIDRGGEALDRPGAFLAPTLLSGGADDDPLHRDELFAPVLSVRPVSDMDEALHHLDALPYGLVAGIVSPVRAEVEAFSREVDAGLVRVNAPTTGLEPHVPFGGSKQSSFGPREQGTAGLRFFSETRTIYG